MKINKTKTPPARTFDHTPLTKAQLDKIDLNKISLHIQASPATNRLSFLYGEVVFFITTIYQDDPVLDELTDRPDSFQIDDEREAKLRDLSQDYRKHAKIEHYDLYHNPQAIAMGKAVLANQFPNFLLHLAYTAAMRIEKEDPKIVHYIHNSHGRPRIPERLQEAINEEEKGIKVGEEDTLKTEEDIVGRVGPHMYPEEVARLEAHPLRPFQHPFFIPDQEWMREAGMIIDNAEDA